MAGGFDHGRPVMLHTSVGLSFAVALALVASTERFGALLPKQPTLVRTTSDQDAYGQRVGVTVYRSADPYRRVVRFYERRLRRRRLIRITESRESVVPGYVLDPQDPRSFVPVLRVQNLDYRSTWAAVFVRPIESGGSLVVVLERRPPPEIAGDDPPERLEIPKAVFETEGLRPLKR